MSFPLFVAKASHLFATRSTLDASWTRLCIQAATSSSAMVSRSLSYQINDLFSRMHQRPSIDHEQCKINAFHQLLSDVCRPSLILLPSLMPSARRAILNLDVVPRWRFQSRCVNNSEIEITQACNAISIIPRHMTVRRILDLDHSILTMTSSLGHSTMASFFLINRLNKADFPTFGRPTNATCHDLQNQNHQFHDKRSGVRCPKMQLVHRAS